MKKGSCDMIEREKPFYSAEQATILFEKGLMPEYIYRQLYFSSTENVLYYQKKRNQRMAEKLNQQRAEKELEKQIEEAIENGVSKALDNLFKQ